MINYEEALKIALLYKSKINHCIEYTNAYSFEFDTGTETKGGDSPIVVMKESGNVMQMIEYAILPDKDYIRDFKIEEGYKNEKTL